MSDRPNLSVIILTYNEERNIERCLKSVADLAEDIFIVDSYSSDATLEIARTFTSHIYQHPFETQAEQFNWALENLPLKTEWLMRLDADEMVTPGLSGELVERLGRVESDVTGFYVKRRVYFMDRWMRHGGVYPTWLLRIWRNSKARVEDRFLNEHVILREGKSARLKNDIVDWNQKDLAFWTDKHNGFSTRGAKEIIATRDGTIKNLDSIVPSLLGSQEKRKRWLNKNLYLRLPLFLRSLVYFLYRYIIRLGFLDGREGLMYHVLQGFWYHFLIDAKVFEYCAKERK
jgi:glycosyltransferase involved in cell wall biosynthesis